MNRSRIAFLGVLVVALVMGACVSDPPAPVAEVAPAVVASYSIRYYPNNATGGSVPEDTTNYVAGALVPIKGNNEGTLVNTGFSFNGWNTQPDGLGQTYDARGIYGPATFPMGNENAQLYAVWADPVIGPWNLTSVNGRPLVLAQEGFQSMTLLMEAMNRTWTMVSTPTSGKPVTSTGTWSVSNTAVNYAFTSGNIVIFNAVVTDRTLTLTPTSMDKTQVMVFSKQ